MASKPKVMISPSSPMEFDMEEVTTLPDALPTPESNQENAKPTRKGRGRGKAAVSATTKAKPKQPGTIAGKKKAAPKKTGPKRAPLKEQSTNQNPEDTEEVDEFEGGMRKGKEGDQSAASADELVAVKQPVKKARTAAKGKTQPKRKQTDTETLQQIKDTGKDEEFEYTPVTARQTKPPQKARGRPPADSAKAVPESQIPQKVIPDTQEVAMDVEPAQSSIQSEADEEIPQSVFRRTNNAQLNSRPLQPAAVRKQTDYLSDNERGGGDPALRRKLGEMTKKYESLELKYKKLTDVGIKEAEANFEKLKMSAEAKSKAANELIASLKKELATQKALAQESRNLQKQLVAKDVDVSKAQALATELSNALSESHNENKVLQAKIASTRTASTVIESTNSKTPGSAIKGKGSLRTIMVGSAEAAQAAQAAQLKEDLYRDLTGLLVLGVEKGEDADMYDCIQTGRNGTLHFKLGIATNTDENYEETEFQYTPRLDNDRDRDLLAILPDYLSEEITFSRHNAAKFYGRVVETLTKRRTEEDGA
ncbi:MAG: hypothetical protein L6R42_003632 [Xanthoria sp. 1 TBL-2021]|nr:MAG: hypothetical protein L6R42_003632 [Xanthoria sp. 1 TBL-2021]